MDKEIQGTLEKRRQLMPLLAKVLRMASEDNAYRIADCELVETDSCYDEVKVVYANGSSTEVNITGDSLSAIVFNVVTRVL